MADTTIVNTPATDTGNSGLMFIGSAILLVIVAGIVWLNFNAAPAEAQPTPTPPQTIEVSVPMPDSVDAPASLAEPEGGMKE